MTKFSKRSAAVSAFLWSLFMGGVLSASSLGYYAGDHSIVSKIIAVIISLASISTGITIGSFIAKD